MLSTRRKQQQDTANVQCQKCLQYGHWTYMCRNERVFMSRPSRTYKINHPDAKPTIDDKKKKKKKRRYSSPSSSSSSSSESSSSDSETEYRKRRDKKKRSKRRRRHSPSSSSSSSSSDDDERSYRHDRRKQSRDVEYHDLHRDRKDYDNQQPRSTSPHPRSERSPSPPPIPMRERLPSHTDHHDDRIQRTEHSPSSPPQNQDSTITATANEEEIEI
jgi:hypothetical protein